MKRYTSDDTDYPFVYDNDKYDNRHVFYIFYRKHFDRGERYRVIAGCRNFSIREACEHWLDPNHHSHENRIKTLRKLFKVYKVEKRRIPKQYREILGY